MPSLEEYEKIYEMTNDADPLPYDCGKLCSQACCRSDLFSDDEYYIYLLPGEEAVFEGKDTGLFIEEQSSYDHYVPVSWGKRIFVAKCKGPENCVRSMRPIQCRTYPLAPRLTCGGELELVLSDVKTPYTCPLIEKKEDLSEEFVKKTRMAWDLLIKDPAIRDLVKLDSDQIIMSG